MTVNLFGGVLTSISLQTKSRTINDSDEIITGLDSNDDIQYKYTVIVNPENETAIDSEACHPPVDGGSSKIPCRTLYYAFDQFHKTNSVKFYLASPSSIYTHNLTVNFSGVDTIGIFGNTSLYPNYPEVECEDGVGLSFINSNNIKLNTVNFLKCGAPQISTSEDLTAPRSRPCMLIINVGLYFYNCTDVNMSHIEVKNASRATGVVMYNVDGLVEVNTCSFTSNRATADDDCGTSYGGGGFSVEFPYCQPGDDGCLMDNNYDIDKARRNKNATYVFRDSTFHENFACGQSAGNYGGRVLASKSSHQAVGRGGGLSVYLKGNTMGNSILIMGCNFSFNHAVWGGGVLIEMGDTAINNTVEISGCVFVHNHAFFLSQVGTGGGGLFVRTTTYFWTPPSGVQADGDSKVHLENSNFTHNKGLQGGAVSMVLGRHNKYYPVDVIITNCDFQSNEGLLGAAAYLKVFPAIREGYIPHITINSCFFLNNSIKYHNDTVHPVGIGTVYINQLPVNFQNHVYFINNSGSALAVVGTQVNFTGVIAQFIGNLGHVGGGVALLGTASIIVGDTTTLNFTNNNATQYGGAIYNKYIIREDLRSDTDCFIHYVQPFTNPRQWTAYFLFLNNKAERLGNAIFSSSILPCSYDNSQAKEIFCWNDTFWNYGNSNCSDEIHTNPVDFTQHSNTNNLSTPISAYPGFLFQLPLTAWDDLQHNVTNDSVYYAYMENTSLAKVQEGYEHIGYNFVVLDGSPGKTAKLVLQTETSQIMHVKLEMAINDCPPGFVPKGDSNTMCVCLQNSNYGNSLKCFSKELISLIDVSKWLGTLPDKDDKQLYMGSLPFEYREPSYQSYKKLPSIRSELNKRLCGNINRTNILCGECIRGYAVSVNSPDYRCVRCDNLTTTTFIRNLFAYIALTYGPIFILFLAIIFLNFKLTSSAAMGFVLYAQMVGSEVFSLTPNALVSNKHFQRVELAYSTIYGIFNLKSLAFLMKPFCLNKSFNTLDVICLDYGIAAFPLVMIILIYLAVQCTSRFSCPKRRESTINDSDTASSASTRSYVTKQLQHHVPKNTLVHAFSAFMFLSYTKFCLASMKTMAMRELYNSNETYVERRVSLAGQWKFTSHQFIFPYGIIAIFVFIFAVLLPPFLLLGPIQMIDWLIEKPHFRFLGKIWPSITIHTVIDTFQGFYKPGRRFFGSVFVLFRLVVFISYSFAEDINQHYAIQQVAIAVLICLIAMFRPYTNELHNQVNILIFVNLSILNSLTVFMHADSTMHFSAKIYTIQCVLVWLPLIYIICYAIWRRLNKKEAYHMVKDKVKSRLRVHLISPIRPHSEDGTKEEKEKLLKEVDRAPLDVDEDIFQRATTRNCYRPPSRVNSSSSDVTFSEVSGPHSLKFNQKYSGPSTRDSGAGTGTTGSSQSSNIKYTF